MNVNTLSVYCLLILLAVFVFQDVYLTLGQETTERIGSTESPQDQQFDFETATKIVEEDPSVNYNLLKLADFPTTSDQLESTQNLDLKTSSATKDYSSVENTTPVPDEITNSNDVAIDDTRKVTTAARTSPSTVPIQSTTTHNRTRNRSSRRSSTARTTASISLPTNQFPEESKTFQQYLDKIKAFIDELMAMILPKLLDMLSDVEISGDCMKACFKLFMGFRELKDWAVHMVDAMGKPPSGIFRGTGTAMGDYDQCLNIVAKEADFTENPKEVFHGKYCMVRLVPPALLSFYPPHWEKEYKRTILPDIMKSDTIFRAFAEYFPRFGNTSHFKFGLCIPSTCTEEDMLNFIGALTVRLEHTVRVEHCNVKTKTSWRPEQIIIFTLLIALIAFLLVSTTVDVFFVKDPDEGHGKFVAVMSQFSAVRITKILVNTDTPDGNLGFIRGLRLISIMWVVVAHVFYFPELDYYYQLQSLLTLVELNNISIFHMMSNSSFSVDTFFVASAILTAYKIAQRRIKGESARYFRFVTRRILRILPAQLFLIAVYMLLPLCGDGPLWNNLVERSVENCRISWWRNLLFIQNLWWDNSQCLFHLWFLSCLVQYTFLSVPLLIVLTRNTVKGAVVCLCLMVASAITIGITTYHFRFGPGISATNFYFTYMWKQIFKNYMSPWAHMGPYCVGLVVGVVLAKQPKLIFKPIVLVIGWISSVAVGATVVCGLYNFVYPPKTFIIVSAVYNALSRNVWAIALSWLCIVCGRRQGGLVQRLLSWKVLIPFDRLGYFMYLIHLPIMYYYRGRARALSYAGLPDMTVTSLGLLLMTIMLAYVCYVLVEGPLKVLDAFFFPERKKPFSESEKEPVTILEFNKIDDNFSLAVKSTAAAEANGKPTNSKIN